MLSQAEENYLKAILKLSNQNQRKVSTNEIANEMDTKASSVTDMIQKLCNKKYVLYEKYQGVKLTDSGRKYALNIIRKHRLWEVFLVEHLNFNWDEIHEIAEQLEHIQSPELTARLDQFLNFPKYDPHGDPIPNEEGEILKVNEKLLSELSPNQKGVIIGVKDSDAGFLQYLDSIGIHLGCEIEFVKKYSYDSSVEILIKGEKRTLSQQVTKNLSIAVS